MLQLLKILHPEVRMPAREVRTARVNVARVKVARECAARASTSRVAKAASRAAWKATAVREVPAA